MYDFEHSVNKERFIAIGEVGDILFVVFTESNARTVEGSVEEAQKYPIEFDEDCEELSPAMMKAFKCAVVQRNCRKNGKYGTILWRTLKKKKYL